MKHRKISPKKRKFIDFLKTKNSNNQKPIEIAKDIGISLSTYYRWLKNSRFLKIAEEENVLNIEKNLSKILKILLKKALQGDMDAIEIFLERYDYIEDSKNIKKNLKPDRIIKLIRMAKGKNIS